MIWTLDKLGFPIEPHEIILSPTHLIAFAKDGMLKEFCRGPKYFQSSHKEIAKCNAF